MSDHPYALANALNAAGKRRGFIVTSSDGDNELVASHACLEPLADFLRDPIDCPDYLGHEACFFEVGPRSGALLGAFLWNTMRGAAGGGIRLIRYDSVASYVTDGLRLATGMGRKNALTGEQRSGGRGFCPSVSIGRSVLGLNTALSLDGVQVCGTEAAKV